MAFPTPQARLAGLGTSGKEVLHWGLYSGPGERGTGDWGHRVLGVGRKEEFWDRPHSAWGNWPQRVVGGQALLSGAKGRIQRPATSLFAATCQQVGWMGVTGLAGLRGLCALV